jgi:two-component system, chemotaxis family, chemotaxis protein CheY
MGHRVKMQSNRGVTMVDSKKVKRILVVDDQRLARKVISSIMSAHGHVDQAENGQAALALFAAALEDGWGYDLVCMDIEMPGLLNGNQVVRCIRVHEEKLEIGLPVPVVMITSHGNMKEFAAELGLSGANEYIVKPFDHARINEVIQRFLY